VITAVNVIDFDELTLSPCRFNADYLLSVLIDQLILRPVLETKSG